MVKRKTHTGPRTQPSSSGRGGAASASSPPPPPPLPLPPLVVASAVNHLQYMQLSAHVKHYLTERMLRELPKFEVLSSSPHDRAETENKGGGAMEDGMKKKNGGGNDGVPREGEGQERAAAEGSINNLIVGPLLEEEDFSLFLMKNGGNWDGGGEQASNATGNDGETVGGDANKKTEEGKKKPLSIADISDAEWEQFLNQHRALWGEGTSLGLVDDDDEVNGGSGGNTAGGNRSHSSAASRKSGHTSRNRNRLVRHFLHEWTPFAEAHRHDSLVADPLGFLDDLASRFAFWSEALKESTIEASMGEGGDNAAEVTEGNEVGRGEESSADQQEGQQQEGKEAPLFQIAQFPAFAFLHRPSIFQSDFDTLPNASSGCRFDAQALIRSLNKEDHDDNGVNVSDDADRGDNDATKPVDHHDDARQHQQQRITFASLHCAALSLNTTARGATAAANSRKSASSNNSAKKKGGAAAGGKTKTKRGISSTTSCSSSFLAEAIANAQSEVSEANANHSHLMRFLWAATGGTRRRTWMAGGGERPTKTAATVGKKKNASKKATTGELGDADGGGDGEEDLKALFDEDEDDAYVLFGDHNNDDDNAVSHRSKAALAATTSAAAAPSAAIAFESGVLTVVRGSHFGVDSDCTFAGEVCVRGGELKLL